MGLRTFGYCRVSVAVWLLSCLVGFCPVQAQQCFSLEFFYDSSVSDSDDLRTSLQQLVDRRGGIRLYFRDVHHDSDSQQRLDSVRQYFQLENIELPALYGLRQVAGGIRSQDRLLSRVDQILTMTAWVRSGCPHCRAAKAFLSRQASRYPALKIDYREVTSSPTARQEMQRVVERYQQKASSLPVLHYCNGVSIGFDRASTTGRRIQQTLDYWSRPCDREKKKS